MRDIEILTPTGRANATLAKRVVAAIFDRVQGVPLFKSALLRYEHSKNGGGHDRSGKPSQVTQRSWAYPFAHYFRLTVQ